MKNKRSLHPKEAVCELGVSTKTIHRWDQAGKLRAVGNQRRIPVEEILRLRNGRTNSRALCAPCVGVTGGL